MGALSAQPDWQKQSSPAQGRSMPTYPKETAVSPARSRAEVERTLQRYGAQGFLYSWKGNR
jgi:hypothetical protein